METWLSTQILQTSLRMHPRDLGSSLLVMEMEKEKEDGGLDEETCIGIAVLLESQATSALSKVKTQIRFLWGRLGLCFKLRCDFSGKKKINKILRRK